MLVFSSDENKCSGNVLFPNGEMNAFVISSVGCITVINHLSIAHFNKGTPMRQDFIKELHCISSQKIIINLRTVS